MIITKYTIGILINIILSLITIIIIIPDKIWVLLFMHLAISLFAIAIPLRQADWLKIKNIMIAFYTMYALMPALWAIKTNMYDDYIIEYYLLICIIGITGFITGYNIGTYNNITPIIIKRYILSLFNRTQSMKSIRTRTIAIITLGALLFSGYMIRAGGISSTIHRGYGGERYLVVGDLGFLGFGSDWIIVGIIILIAQYMYMKKSGNIMITDIVRTVIIVIILALYIWYLFMTGSRGDIVRITLAIILAYNIFIKRMSMITIIITMTLLYSISVLYGHVRTAASVSGFIGMVMSGFQIASFNLLSPLSFGEYINPGIALFQIISNPTGLWYGLSYINIPAIILPKSIYPNRPLTLGEWRMSTYYPELWVKGCGMGFFTVAEGWLNFGYLGVFVQLFVLGLVVRLLHELRKQGAGNFGITATYIILASYLSLAGIRIDCAPVIKTALFGYVIPCIVIFIIPKIRSTNIKTPLKIKTGVL